jgi:hypothetical protein
VSRGKVVEMLRCLWIDDVAALWFPCMDTMEENEEDEPVIALWQREPSGMDDGWVGGGEKDTHIKRTHTSLGQQRLNMVAAVGWWRRRTVRPSYRGRCVGHVGLA